MCEKYYRRLCACVAWQNRLVVHPRKSTFVPTQVLTVLGFVINSVTLTGQLTREKAICLQETCTMLLTSSSPPIRKIASVIRNKVSSFSGVMHAPFYYQHLEEDRPQALQKRRSNFDAPMSLSIHARCQLQWWIQNAEDAYDVINHPQPHYQIKKQMISLWDDGLNLQGCPQ